MPKDAIDWTKSAMKKITDARKKNTGCKFNRPEVAAIADALIVTLSRVEQLEKELNAVIK